MNYKLVKDNLDGFQGHAALYEIDKPVGYDFDYEKDKNTKKTKYVVVSAADPMFSGPETYIFPANKEGEIVDWGELNGSYKGGHDHDRALAGL